ncbi:MAG: CRISPR-associated endonuclease Cas3'' [Desulfurococcaceae archaeon]
MISPVYSFYQVIDGSLRVERLRTHVEYALESFDKDSRLVRYGSRLRKTFYEILKYVIILHDFGKVAFNQAWSQGRSYKGLSFEGHEVLSAWFADKYLSLAANDNIIDPKDVCLATLVILLHHHPMDVRRRNEALSKKKDIIVNEETINTFYEELRGIINPTYQISLARPLCADDIAEEVLGFHGLYRRCWINVWMNGSPTDRKTFLLLIQGLIVADYKSASRTRGEGISEFARAVQIFLNYWST